MRTTVYLPKPHNVLPPKQLFSFHLINSVIVGTQLVAIFLSLWISLFPGQDELMNIVGTFSEILAGLYGVTLTSYIFFLTRIDALTATDYTLEFVVESLKTRFKYIIWYITCNVGFTLLVSLILMYSPSDDPGFLYRLFCNEFIVLLFQSVSFILYFGISVIDPNRLEKEASKLKKKLSSSGGPQGDVMEFMSLYGRIEDACNAMVPEDILTRLHDNKGKVFTNTLGLLKGLGLLDAGLQGDIFQLHCYYSCVVNCRSVAVSQQMCDLARSALARLDAKSD